MSIIKHNTIKVMGKPSGWVVRSQLDKETGISKSLEFGMYITADVFISIPLHFRVLNDGMLKITLTEFNTPEVKYYYLPEDIALKLIKIPKNGRQMPLLIPAGDNKPSYLVCYSYECSPYVIGDISTNGKVVRDFITPDRHNMAIIVLDPRENIINNSVDISIISGVKGEMVNTTHVEHFEMGIGVSDTDVIKIDEPFDTKYVTFDRFLPTRAQLAKKAEGGAVSKEASNWSPA